MSKISSVKVAKFRAHLQLVDDLLKALKKTAKRLRKEGLSKGDALRAAIRLFEADDIIVQHDNDAGH